MLKKIDKTLENIEEIIYCIIPSTYDKEDNTLTLSKEGPTSYIYYYLNFTDTPNNINF